MLPEDLGIWNSVQIAITYSPFLLAGVINGLGRELPFYLGTQKVQDSDLLASTALCNITAGCVIVFFCGIGSAVFFHFPDVKILNAVIAVTFLIIFTFYHNYLLVTFRSKEGFQSLSKCQIIEAFLMFLTIPIIYFFRFYGVISRVVIVSGIVLFFLHLLRPIKVKPVWDKASFKKLINTGLPIFGLDYIRTTASTFDRVVLLSFAGTKEVGYYALATIAHQTLSRIPMAIGQYTYPKMTYSYGKENNPLILWRMARKAMLVVFIIMFPIAIAGWFILPPLIETYFPKYIEGTRAACLMLFSAVFYSVLVGANVLWSMKAWRWMVVYQTLFSALLIVGPLLGALMCSSLITGVAYGMLCANFINMLLGISIIYHVTHQ